MQHLPQRVRLSGVHVAIQLLAQQGGGWGAFMNVSFPGLPATAEVGAVAFKASLQGGDIDIGSVAASVAGEVCGSARGLAHDEAGAGDPRRRLRLVAHRSAAAGDPQVVQAHGTVMR